MSGTGWRGADGGGGSDTVCAACQGRWEGRWGDVVTCRLHRGDPEGVPGVGTEAEAVTRHQYRMGAERGGVVAVLRMCQADGRCFR